MNAENKLEKLNSNFLEKLIFKTLQDDKEYLEDVLSSFIGAYFDDPNLDQAFTFIQKHYREYGILPINDILINSSESPDEIRSILEQVDQVDQENNTTIDFIRNHTDDYLKEKALKLAIINSVDEVEDPERRNRIQERVDKALSLSLNKSNNLMVFPFDGETYRQRTDIKDQKYWLYPIVPNGGHLTVMAGPKGSGKTWIGLKMADSIAKNEDFDIWKAYEHDLCVPSGGKILYVDGEMSGQDVKSRLELLETNSNFVPYPLMDKAYEKLNLTKAKDRKKFEDSVIKHKFKVIFLDNLSCLFPGVPLNDSGEGWSPYNQWLINLSRKHNIHIILIAHMGKNESLGVKGTTGITDHAENIIYLKNLINNENRKMKTQLDFKHFRTGGQLPLEDQIRLLGKPILTLDDGTMSVEEVKKSSTDNQADELHYRAMSCILAEPDIRVMELRDLLHLGKNNNIMRELERKFYIEKSRPDAKTYKGFKITDLGRQWHGAMTRKLGENRDLDRELDG